MLQLGFVAPAAMATAVVFPDAAPAGHAPQTACFLQQKREQWTMLAGRGVRNALKGSFEIYEWRAGGRAGPALGSRPAQHIFIHCGDTGIPPGRPSTAKSCDTEIHFTQVDLTPQDELEGQGKENAEAPATLATTTLFLDFHY